jgi:hypothetical protein
VLLNLRNGGRYSIHDEFRPELLHGLQLPGASRVMAILAATLSPRRTPTGTAASALPSFFARVRRAPFDDRSRRQTTFWRSGAWGISSPCLLMI